MAFGAQRVYAHPTMALWRRRTPQPPSLTCYGKLPATGDFIRHNAMGAESQGFDKWLQGAVNLAKQTLDAGFLPAYQGSVGLFIYRGDDGDANAEPERGMVGVWAASGDSAGRHYPMMVATTYDYEQLLGVGAALPIAVWPFLQAAYELVQNGRGLSAEQFLARVQQLPMVSLDSPEQARASYLAWLQQHSMRELWDATFGTVASRFAALQLIHASVDYFRGQERPQSNLAIRFPLASGDAWSVAVWTDLMLRIAEWQRTVLNAYWTPQREALLHIGPPHVGTLRALLAPGTCGDHITDLLEPLLLDEATAREKLGAKLRAAVDNPDVTIAAFLASI